MPRIPVHIFAADPATGNALSGVTATVKNRVTASNAALFSAETGGSSVTNPLTTDSNGRALAYTERAPLQIDYAGAGITAFSEYRDTVIEVVTGLPGSPYDGQEIYFQSSGMAAKGIAWHLRYRAGASGSYKWEFLGGGPWNEVVSTSQTTNSTSFVDLATVGPSITVPLAGDYAVTVGAKLRPASGSFAAVGVSNNGTVVSEATAALNTGGAGGGNMDGDCSKTWPITVVTAGHVVKAVYQSGTASNSTFQNRSLVLVPVRLG